MSDFLSVEEAARGLGVPESLVRQWIRRGLARASRRGGDYTLRVAEVERLRQESAHLQAQVASAELSLPLPIEVPSTEPEPSPSPKPKARVLPPRSKDPDSFAGDRDRRRRMGRRASDFTLELLHQEIKTAVAAALDPLLPRLDELQSQLQSPRSADPFAEIERAQSQLQFATHAVAEPAPPHDVSAEIERLHSELQQARAQTESADQQWQAERNQHDELQRHVAELEVRLAQQEPAQLLLQRRVAELEEELERSRTQRDLLEQAREGFRQRLEESERALNADGEERVNRLTQQLDALGLQLEAERQTRQQLEIHLQSVQSEQDLLRQHWEAELEQARSERDRARQRVSESESGSLTIEAERARWSLESRSLQTEIDRLVGLHARFEEQRRDLESQLQREREAHAQVQQRLEMVERADKDAALRFEGREHQLESEIRRLKEQVNSLNYRLTMAGTGTAGPSPEESRKLLDRIADAEAQMAEKDQLIHQNYGEIGDLRSKLEALQRQHYELQQSYDQVHDKWSQLVAQQWQSTDHQQQPPAPGTGPDGKKPSNWLFRMRGE
jgi:excisionase family DNA binding protein